MEWVDIVNGAPAWLDVASQEATILYRRILAVAAQHPIVAGLGVLLPVAVGLLTRSVSGFLAALFLCAIAALMLSPGLTDRTHMSVAILALATVLLMTIGLVVQRGRARQFRARTRRTESELEEVRELYNREVKWRMAAADPSGAVPESKEESSPPHQASAARPHRPAHQPIAT